MGVEQASSSIEDELKKPDIHNPSLLRQIECAFFGMTTGLMFGWCIGYVSVGLDSLRLAGEAEQAPFLITDAQVGTFGSFMNLAGIAGAVLSGPATHRFGRKWPSLLGFIPYVIGWALIAFPTNFSMMLVGQCLCGFGQGFRAPMSRLYIAEAAHVKFRGRILSSIFSTSIFTTFVQYVLAMGLDWKQLAIFNGIFTAVIMPLHLRVPESHIWLISKGRIEEARKSLQWSMGDHYDCETEFQDAVSHENDTTEAVGSIRDALNFQYLKPVFIMLIFIVARQFSGGTVILFFTSQILRKSNSGLDPKYAVLILGFFQLIFVVFGGWMMDKLGRKKCIAISGTVMAVGHVGMGIYSYCEVTPDLQYIAIQNSWLPVVLLTVTQIGFNFSMATLVFILLGEIIPVQIKNHISGLMNAVNSGSTSATLQSFHYMILSLGKHGTFWVYAGICLFVVVFLNLTLTETSGKSLSDIERKMTNTKSLTKMPEQISTE